MDPQAWNQRRERPRSDLSGVDSIMNAYVERSDTPVTYMMMGEALEDAINVREPRPMTSPAQEQQQQLKPPQVPHKQTRLLDAPTIERTDRPYSPLVSQDIETFEPVTRSLSMNHTNLNLLRHSESTTSGVNLFRSSGNTESAYDDTFSYVLSKSDCSIKDDQDNGYIDSVIYNKTSRPASTASASSSDQDHIISQYIDSPKPSLVRRRPTEPSTPTYDRQGLRRQRLLSRARDRDADRDSLSSFGIHSGFDSDESLAKRSGSARSTRILPVPDMYAGSAADRSVVSLADQSSDQLLMQNDYNSLTLADAARVDELMEADREWDEKTPKLHQTFSMRGCVNMTMLILLLLSTLMLFLGYPVLHAYTEHRHNEARQTPVDTNLEAISALPRSRIDPSTPHDALTRQNTYNNKTMRLVFSDEFETPGRSFYAGEDPFWEAESLHYWQTKNYEWYHPSAITTVNGSLMIKLSQYAMEGLNFRGGLLTSWNKFCFTGGFVETKLKLPGRNNVSGLWPAVWAMGNLGRAGYGASTYGLWPYSYDVCDVGTLPNQTYLASQGGGPLAAETTGRYVEDFGPGLSYSPGQRLSRCTCLDSDDHPGPRHEDGTWVGRSAPEIDLIEALGNNGPEEHGQTSMSLQIAPFDAAYNVSDPSGLHATSSDKHGAIINDYTGAVFQQAVSAKVNTSDDAYTMTKNEWDTYAFEYNPGVEDDSYIRWFMSGDQVFQVDAKALGPNNKTEIGARQIPVEPMYLIMNLGISASFSWINWDEIMRGWQEDSNNYAMYVDYIRVYQNEDEISEDSLSCSPSKYPTFEYIERHKEVYTNPLLTTWTEPPEKGGYNHSFPGNVMLGQCT